MSPSQVGYVVWALVCLASVIFLDGYLWPTLLPFWTELGYQWQSLHVAISLPERIYAFLIYITLAFVPSTLLGALAGLAAEKIAKVLRRQK